jgi:hypothetical protein
MQRSRNQNFKYTNKSGVRSYRRAPMGIKYEIMKFDCLGNPKSTIDWNNIPPTMRFAPHRLVCEEAS